MFVVVVVDGGGGGGGVVIAGTGDVAAVVVIDVAYRFVSPIATLSFTVLWFIFVKKIFNEILILSISQINQSVNQPIMTYVLKHSKAEHANKKAK